MQMDKTTHCQMLQYESWKWGTFTHKLAKNLKVMIDCPKDMKNWTARDNEINKKIKLHPDTERVIQKFTSAITAACDTTFQVTRPGNQAAKKRRVHWWTEQLTILRKKKAWGAILAGRTLREGNARVSRRSVGSRSGTVSTLRKVATTSPATLVVSNNVWPA